jgi:oxygen-dependent protoporphyrinogen oxidase
MSHTVIVIGAGIAGLITAYELQKKGCRVELLEASPIAGGRMHTHTEAGFVMDAGAQFLSSEYPILSSLIEELGLASERVTMPSTMGIVKNGTIRKLRYSNPFSLLTSGVLGLRSWFALGYQGFKIVQKTRSLPVNDLSAWAAYDDEDARSWCQRTYTKEVCRCFYEPMLEAFYFQQLHETSKALPLALAKFNRAQAMTTQGGINLLVNTLADTLKIHYNTAAHQVILEGDKVVVKTDDGIRTADSVVIATPAPIAQKIYRPLNAHEKQLLESPYSSTITLSIALNDAHVVSNLDDLYGIWIPAVERKHIAAITMESAKCHTRVPQGKALINIMLDGQSGKEMIDQEDHTVIDSILDELQTYFPRIKNHVDFVKLFRWRYAEPLSYVGRARAIRDYKAHIDANTRIFLAGDYMSMPFTEGAAQSAFWVVERIEV